MKKKLLTSLLAVGILFTLTACGGGSGEVTKKPDKGNCTALECIKDLSDKSTVEDINKLIGFEGEKTDDKYNIYEWKIGDDDSITATYYSGGSANIEASYNKDDLKDSKIDFSKYNDIKTALKSKDSITYDDFCDKVNGKGHLYYVSSSTNKYVWVNENGEYLTASFSNSSNKCTFVTGMINKANQ